MMIHQLLLSLLGFPGDIIVENEKLMRFQVKDGYDQLSESEVVILYA